MNAPKDVIPSKPSRSIDGFVMPEAPSVQSSLPQSSPENQPITAPTEHPRASIDLTLPDEQIPSPSNSKHRWFFRRRRRQGTGRIYERKLRKRLIITALVVLLVIVLGAGGYFAWKILSNASKVFQGNIFGAVTSLVSPDKPLKTDQYGNTNILALGTSESDPNHPGAELTDSIMVISYNKSRNTAFLLSVPRDLWVQYDTPCSAGYSGKINAVYECSLGSANGGIADNNNSELAAEKETATKVGEVLGMDIQYVVHMNLEVVQKVVDAVGGIDIKINSSDPRGIYDPNFDWRCHYKCKLVYYPNGLTHMDGYHAMWFVQARNDAGGYGLPRGNFDREADQREVLIAVEKKALSAGFLANPANAVNFLDALGSNVHTTIDASELKTFIDTARNVPTGNIYPIDILENSGASPILMTGMGPDGSSIVEPTAGLLNYSDLQAFTSELLKGGSALIAEGAKVDVINASGVSGAAAQEATNLQQLGYTIGDISSAPSNYSSTAQYTLYDLSKGSKPATLAALKKELGISKVQTILPNSITSTASFVVVLGGSPATNSGN